MTTPNVGIATAPQGVGYDDLLRVWREADAEPRIGHAWLFDHLLPIAGGLDGPIFEGWTLLSAMAALTSRIRLGLLVTSNRFRPPTMLAKIATTVDIVSGGRLDFGIGAGSRPSVPWARQEYDANGLPYLAAADAVASLAESLEIIRRHWTSEVPFDHDGRFQKVTGAFGNPKPVQRPGPPVVVGGRAASTLRVVARYADVWNVPGGDLADCVARSGVLDGFCAEIGRDPAEITRSIVLPVAYDDPGVTRGAVERAVEAGFPHVVLSLPAPYPDGVAAWLADEVIPG
ncbi:LLM class flavin-dependent oxidoreductase [Jatrophihabitans sp. YIM 134969]